MDKRDPGIGQDPAEARQKLARSLGAVALGDRRALQEVYAATAPKLFGVVLRIVPNRHEAEDVLQDIYLTVWNKAGSFDSERGSPITWLAAIARNKAIDRRRSMKAHGEELPATAAETIADGAPSAVDQLEWSQDRALLLACIETLEARIKTAICEAFLNGHTYDELAQRTGVPLGTMKSWIRRGLQKLRGCLES